MFHQWTVLKAAGINAVFHTLRDTAVERCKVANAAGFGAGIIDDGGQRGEYFVDAGGLHFNDYGAQSPRCKWKMRPVSQAWQSRILWRACRLQSCDT
jgi:hypothetical protein